VGEVTINGVSESQSAGIETTPVAEAFRFRMLVHVNAAGQANLLKEATQMWKEGTTMPDSQNSNFQVVDEPGRYVWLTDESLIPNFSGATLRDGVPVGLRVSTAAYDFPENHLPMVGAFNESATLTITLNMDHNAATNPYKHRYHPDHDNLDAQFLNAEVEAFDIARTFTLEFDAAHPADRPGPSWGSNEVGGVFKETITGMHRHVIYTEGSFLFTRIAATAELNQ
ncbi:hypothetical protein AC249_AIPGENE6410, partial [Exaiptasia diaphana]